MIKNIKKISVLTLSLIVACSTLTGCHGAKATEAYVIPETFDTSKQYELTFWAKNDTNITQKEIYLKAISDFEKLYPNITVNMRLYTDYQRLYSDVITNISTNTTPNICITYPDHIATYKTGVNTVVELDDLMADEKYGLGGSELRFDGPSKEEIIPQFLNECIIGENYYALPYMRSTEATYVNKTYVEKLGYEVPDILTWDFVWEVSEKAMEMDASGNYKLNGQKVMIPFIDKSTDNMMIQSLHELNAGYSTEAGEVQIFNDDTRMILDTVAKHTANGAFSTFKISSYPGNFLNAGQCLFAIDSTAGATWMGAKAPNQDIAEDKLVEFELVVRPFPQYDIENISMISQGPSICIFNKADSNEVLASWLFAQYMLTNEVQTAYSETEGYVPVTSKAQNSAEYMDYLSRRGEDIEHYETKIDAAKLLIDNVDKTFVTPVFNGSASLRTAAGELIENVTKSVRRKETINDAYYTKMYATVTSQYHLKETSGNVAKKQELGPLPSTSVKLLIALLATWLLIGGAFLLKTSKKRANSKKN